MTDTDPTPPAPAPAATPGPIGAAIAAVVEALEAAGLRVALRAGDITPPVVYLQIGAASALGGVLEAGLTVTVWLHVIPVRGTDNLTTDADQLDRIYAAVGDLAAADMPTTRTAVTVGAETWPGYRIDLTALVT